MDGKLKSEKRRFNKMNFTSKKLMIPLFMLNREPLRQTQMKFVKEYIAKKGPHYTDKCNRENDYLYETATLKYLRHVAGLDYASQPEVLKRCPKGFSKYTRDTQTPKSFHLPPNLYDTLKIPYKHRLGLHCVKWYAPQTRPKRAQQTSKQMKYWQEKDDVEDKPINNNNLNPEQIRERKRCPLDFNARTMPPTSRSMCLSVPDRCSPGPAYYDGFDKVPGKACKYVFKEKRKHHSYSSAYRFLRGTTVPETSTFLNDIMKNSSFGVGPGRYETRFGCSCTHWQNKVYEPNLLDIMAKQRHLKFLGLQYTKINAAHYYCPEYQHIKGHGHTYRFKGVKRENSQKNSKGAADQDKFVADGPYVQRILNPKRKRLYVASPEMPAREQKVQFNCLMKFAKKKSLKVKKIGFSSTQPRFKDDEKPKGLTAMELEGLRKIPMDRRVHNYPITTKPLSEIKGKLHDIEQDTTKTIIRKKAFKFAPIPGVKILVQESDYRPVLEENEGFYFKNYKYEDFFMNTSKESIVKYPSIYSLD